MRPRYRSLRQDDRQQSNAPSTRHCCTHTFLSWTARSATSARAISVSLSFSPCCLRCFRVSFMRPYTVRPVIHQSRERKSVWCRWRQITLRCTRNRMDTQNREASRQLKLTDLVLLQKCLLAHYLFVRSIVSGHHRDRYNQCLYLNSAR